MSDEVLRVQANFLNDQQRTAWCNLVSDLGQDPSQVRDKRLLTRDDEHGYRLHMSIKTRSDSGGDLLDRATNDVVSTPLVLAVTPDQLTTVLSQSRSAE